MHHHRPQSAPLRPTERSHEIARARARARSRAKAGLTRPYEPEEAPLVDQTGVDPPASPEPEPPPLTYLEKIAARVKAERDAAS